MDVRETTELDEDERIITIADGSDTGIVNAQVPEADIIRYKDSTYEIVSKIAYLIGVPKRIFAVSYTHLSSRMGKNAQLLMETFLYMGGMEYLDMLTTQTMKDALS